MVGIKRIVLLLAVIVVSMPSWAATDYQISVGGRSVDSDNAAHITDDNIGGSVSYDPATNTLTLDGAVISANGISAKASGLNIQLIGSNVINLGKINVVGKLTIYGTGSLSITSYTTADSESQGISCKELLVDGVTLNIHSFANSIYVSDGTLTARNADITLENTSTAFAVTTTYYQWISMEGCDYITPEPAPSFVKDYSGSRRYDTNYDGALLHAMHIGPVPEDEVKYPVIVNKKYVRSTNAADVLGDGKVSYDASTNTLTLNDATFTTTSSVYSAIEGGIVNNLPTTVNLVGTSNIGSSSTAINGYVGKITGAGTLNLSITSTEWTYGISSNSPLTIDGTTVSVTGGRIGIYGETLIDNSTVTISGCAKSAIQTEKLTLRKSKIVSPVISDFYALNIGAGQNYIADADGNVAKAVTIIPDPSAPDDLTAYPLYLGSTRVTSLNAADVLGDGKVSYDAVTNTLTLNNATINGHGTTDGLRSEILGLTINLIGNNVINNIEGSADDNGQQFAMELAKWTTICSSTGGTLTTNVPAGTGSYGSICALGNERDGTLYIKDCTVTVNGGTMGLNCKGQPFKIQNSTVTIQNQEADYYNPFYVEPLILLDCQIVEPEGAVLNKDRSGLDLKDETTVKKVIIMPLATATREITGGLGMTTNESETDARIGAPMNYAEREVEIPQTVSDGGTEYTITAVDDKAFQENTTIESVTLPATVDYVGEYAFDGCSSLTSVTLESTTPPFADRGAFDEGVTDVYYPAAAAYTYREVMEGYSSSALPSAERATYHPTVMMKDNEWTTIYSTQDYDLPEGLEAYIVTGINYETAQVMIRRQDYILSGTPMLLHKLGTEKNYVVPEAMSVVYDGEPSDVFRGSPREQAITNEGGQAYILYNGQFVKCAPGTLGAFKCYLWIPEGPEGKSLGGNARALTVLVENATGIGEVRSSGGTGSYVWYTLGGQKVVRPAKPGIYLQGGKKMYIK